MILFLVGSIAGVGEKAIQLQFILFMFSLS